MSTFPRLPAAGSALRSGFCAALLLGGILCAPAYADLPPEQRQGSVQYVSGGIGFDESTAFKAAMSRYPLALTFASRAGEKAAYVSDVQVVIRDRQDNNVLNVTSEGPYFLARLPDGQYRLFVTYDNKTLSRTVDVHGSKTTRALFEWK